MHYEHYEDDDPVYTHDLTDQNVTDLQREVDALRQHRGRLVGIVTDEAGGIIAYAIGENNAARITRALLTEEV